MIEKLVDIVSFFQSQNFCKWRKHFLSFCNFIIFVVIQSLITLEMKSSFVFRHLKNFSNLKFLQIGKIVLF